MATPGTRARIQESREKWIGYQYSIKEGLQDLDQLAATVTRETTECTRIIRATADPTEEEQ